MAAVTGAVIGAAAVANSAYQGKKNRDAAARASRNTAEAPYLQEAQEFATTRGREIADRQYTPYTGQRVAGQTANEVDAGNLAAVNSDQSVAARRNLGRAGEMVDEVAGSEFNAENIEKYSNPYIQGVIDPAKREAKRAYSDELANLRGKAASMGAFGSDRSTMLESNLSRNFNTQLTDIDTKGRAYAYDKAVEGWKSDNSRRLAASDAYRAVGGDISRLNTAQITDLMRTGQSKRLLEQAQLDFNYDQFLEERDWDVTNLQPLLASIGASKGGNVTTTESGPKADKLGTILGAAGTLIGYFGGQQGAGGGAPSSMWGSDQIGQSFEGQNLAQLDQSINNLPMPTTGG
jgi:hypothetical protein